MEIDQTIYNFCEGLYIKQYGEKNYPSKAEVVADIFNSVQDFLIKKMIGRLSDAQLEEAEMILEKEGEQKFGAYLMKRIPNLEKFISENLIEYRSLFLN